MIESVSIPYQRPSHPGWTVRLFGYALLGDIRNLLKAHRLLSSVRSAGRLSNSSKLRAVRDQIDMGYPVILAIGNGHLRRGHYSPWARLLLGHYLTVYGYDHPDETFFVYDSYLAGDPETPLPIGNDTRSYTEMIRDWKGPIYYRLIRRNHPYIHIETPEQTINKNGDVEHTP